MRGLLLGSLGAIVCATAFPQTKALTTDELAKYTGKNMSATAYPSPTFTHFKPTNAIFGLFGGLAANSAGNALVKSHAIDDPALGIARTLATKLATSIGATPMADPGVSRDDDLESVIASVPGADVLVDVRTGFWGTIYIATQWGRNYVKYTATLRVIDSATKSVLGKASCVSTQGESHGVTDEQMMANGAAQLKYFLQQAQFDCTDQFAKTVLGYAALPWPADALANPLLNVKIDDVAVIPHLVEKGREDYKIWLTIPGPKAFAIATSGYWGRAGGLKPTDASAPSDPIDRALLNCKRYSKQTCQLYAVNGKVVYGSDFAARAEAAFEKSKPSGAASPSDTQPSTTATYSPSGFADVNEVDLVPYLSDKGRADYATWLKWPEPRAFAVSPSGYYAHVTGTKPKDPAMPSDPVERALAYCQKNSPTTCKVYALNANVVFNKD